MPIEVDLESFDVDTLDSVGFVTEPGFYQATIEDVSTDPEYGATVFDLIVSNGPHSGAPIKFFLSDYTRVEDKEKRLKARNRVVNVSRRLGLVTDDQLREMSAAGRLVLPEWAGAISKQVWVQMVPDDNPKFKVQTAYLPLYPLDHHDVPIAVRQAAGIPINAEELAAAAAGTANGKKAGGSAKKNGKAATEALKPASQVDFNDLC